MSRETLIDLLYLFAATTFVLALKGLGSPKHARKGNMVAAFGMLVAVVATFFKYVDGHSLHHIWLILLGMFIGALIAVPTARFIKMTAMPQLVAIFNGVGGGAAAFAGVAHCAYLCSHSLTNAGSCAGQVSIRTPSGVVVSTHPHRCWPAVMRQTWPVAGFGAGGHAWLHGSCSRSLTTSIIESSRSPRRACRRSSRMA